MPQLEEFLMAQPTLELRSSDFVALNNYPVPVRYVPGAGGGAGARSVRDAEISKVTAAVMSGWKKTRSSTVRKKTREG